MPAEPIDGSDAFRRHVSCGAGSAPSLARINSTLAIMRRTLTVFAVFMSFVCACVASEDPRDAWLRGFATARLDQQLETIPLPAGWVDHASVRLIDKLAGFLPFRPEAGTTLFCIYPYFDMDPAGGAFQRAYLDVSGENVSVSELKAAFLGQVGHKALRVRAYALYSPLNILFHLEPKNG